MLATFTVINVNDSGAGSLRDAINLANTTVGADTIAFAIPGAGVRTISPLAALPAITDSVTIDGTTQGASPTPLIEIDGTSAGTSASGVRLTGGSSTLRGLAINNFKLNGVLLTSNGNKVEGSFIGVNPNGLSASPNLLDGIQITSSSNVIGGTAVAAANVISGNGRNGVSISGTTASNNSVIGNTVGLDFNKLTKVPNVNAGVRIGSGAKLNNVGGLTPNEANYISGNTGFGVLIENSGTDSNIVQGNSIGNGAGAVSDVGNGVGVAIRSGAKLNQIGTSSVGGGNVISANATWGVQLRGAGTSNNQVAGNNIGGTNGRISRLANGEDGVLIDTGATNNTIGGTTSAHANTISGNTKSGITISGVGTNANKVLFNTIGLNSTGTTAVGNSLAGVTIRAGAANNEIGSATAGNTISGNQIAGVRIQGASNNSIRGNAIGLNLGRTAAIPNSLDGVVLEQAASANTIGGATASEGNVISGNTRAGVRISGSGTTGNSVQFNKIGTAADTTVAIGNLIGVWITAGAKSNSVGLPSAGNTISGNLMFGVSLTGVGTDNNTIRGNRIGLTESGEAKQANLDGVNISAGAKNNTIGGTNQLDRNTISGNTRDGIGLTGASTASNIIVGNYVGLSQSGLGSNALKNARHGISILQGAKNTLIGSSAVADSDNFISSNGTTGILISDVGSSAIIVNNTIGLLPTGVSGLLTLTGVQVTNGATATIGGVGVNEGNLISGNNIGIFITSATTSGVTIQGNVIGLDPTGTLARPNGTGVAVINAKNTSIGGSSSARNIISGNSRGILAQDASNVSVKGNYIGTDATGLVALPNNDGIFILGTNSVQIGGPTPGERNIISGNGRAIELQSSPTSPAPDASVRLENNYMGLGSDGTTVLPNGDGAYFFRFFVPTVFVNNVISGNQRIGTYIDISENVTLVGNKIGVLADGVTPAGNGSHGVLFTRDSAHNRIGGELDGEGNIIAFNGGNGILVGSDPPSNISLAGIGNTLIRNSIYNNGRLSIDLGPNDGVTPNDANDLDTGPNNLLNAPEITLATAIADSLVLRGTLTTFSTLRIEFYSSPVAGQAKQYLGYIIQPVTSSFDQPLAVVLEATVDVGSFITAIATDLNTGDTSELSLAVQVV